MTPRPYQLVGRDFLAARTRALLADEPRVGKTPQAIMAADKLGAERVLVLCPAGATYQWAAQWAEWSPDRRVAIVDRELPALDPGVWICSYNRAVQHLEALAVSHQRWDVLIVDEAHFAKSPTAKRTQAVYGKGGIGHNAMCIWALTGTPSPNHAGETWPLLRAFGATPLPYWKFVEHFCYCDVREGRIYGNRRQRLPELRALLAPLALRRTLREVAPQMPRVAFNLLAVAPAKGIDLRSNNPDDVDTEDRIAVAMAKVPELAKVIAESIEAGQYSQTVVFGYHVEPLRLLGELLTAAGYDACVVTGATPLAQRAGKQAAFKAGVCQVYIGQLIASGTAIDLSAAQHGYFLELSYVPGDNTQAAHRLVNVATGLPVTFDVLTWPGTKDDQVQKILLRKVRDAVFTS